MIILKEIINKDFHLELFTVQHSFRDNFNIKDAFYRCNSFVFMVRFNLFRDVKVAGVASFYQLSFSQDVYRNKSFERFWLPKSVEDEKNGLMMQYWNQQLIKPNSHVRFLRNESISEILYFGARRPFYHKRLWRRSTNFEHSHYRYVFMQCELLAVEVRSRSTQLFWRTLSFPFVVLDYL